MPPESRRRPAISPPPPDQQGTHPQSMFFHCSLDPFACSFRKTLDSKTAAPYAFGYSLSRKKPIQPEQGLNSPDWRSRKRRAHPLGDKAKVLSADYADFTDFVGLPSLRATEGLEQASPATQSNRRLTNAEAQQCRSQLHQRIFPS